MFRFESGPCTNIKNLRIMEMYGNIRCVTHAELVEGGVITHSNYINYVKRKLFVFHQRGGNGRVALIDYNSLPERVRERYDAVYPDADAELKRQFMRNLLRQDPKAVEFYRRYELTGGSGLTDKKQAEYTLNAEVMNEMVRVEKATQALHSKCGYRRPNQVWDVVISTCEELRRLYGHTLPNNAARLREKFNAYKKDGYIVLVSGKNGNASARKIGASEARLLLKLKRSRLPVYTDAQIFDEYNRRAVESGTLNPIKSINTLHNYLYAPEVISLWYGAVHGMQQWKAKFTTLMKTALPSMRDSLWYSDGTKLNLYYKDSCGKMCTTSVYEVMDAYSEVLLGYDIAPNENFDSQYKAFRMAVEIAGTRPFEIVNDNQGGHKKAAAQGFFDRIAVLRKPTMPYNGQSKTIESAFGRFQQQILHKIWYFTGQNVTSKKLSSRPNLEFIEANAFALPTLEEMKEIYRQCRDEWNKAAHPKTGIVRMEMYMMSENPESQAVSQEEMRHLFWLKSKKSVTYTNKGVEITLNRQTYEYDVYGTDGLRNEQWALRNTGRQFHVMYDPMDMTRVELWEVCSTGLRFSTEATPKVVISRGTQERTSEETSFMRRTIEQSKNTMALIQISMEEFDLDEQIAAELFGLVTPQPKNVSPKMIERIRDDYEHGRMKAPISLPEKQVMVEEEEEMAMTYSSFGEETKYTSNLTFDDVCCYEKM